MRDTDILSDGYDLRLTVDIAGLNPSHNFRLQIVQQPENARGVKWPIEPPPVLELTSPEKDAQKWHYIHNPNWFCVADLLTIEVYPPKPKSNAKKEKDVPKDNLSGLLASSLHKVKNPDDRNEHGYFVFGDLNVRDAGRYKIEFTLFEMRQLSQNQLYAAKVDSITSLEFDIQNTKQAPITKDSTKLSKVLSESGVKLRLRKESSKRKQSTFSWSATPSENFSFGAHRAHTNIAPTHGPQMPPPSNPNARFSRNSGEDITRRLSVVHNDMGSTSFTSQAGVMNPMTNMSQPGSLHNTAGHAPSGHYDYNVQHTLSPLSRMPLPFPPTTREMSSYSGQVSLQSMQQTSQQPWSFPGQGSFRPEAHQDQHQMYNGQQLSDRRSNFERGDSGYSSHGRPSLGHMDSGVMDAYHARPSPYGPTSMPGMPLPQAEPMQSQEWNMDPNLPSFAGYDTMNHGRQREMGTEQEVPYTFSAGNGPVYSYSLPQNPGLNQ